MTLRHIVCTSIFSKNQWRNRQLQYWIFDPNFPDGNFIYMRDQNREIGQEIGWYLYMTEMFARTFLNSLSQNRTLIIHSEELFSKSQNMFLRLQKLAPEVGTDFTRFYKIFAKPINQKDDFKMYSQIEIDAVCGSMKKELKKLKTRKI